MCTSPITIQNKRKRFIPYVDREFIKVPCGKCFECRNARRNELYVLSYYEHLQAVSNGGFTQFFTLTYNNDSLPFWSGRPCFSRDNVKHYLMSVTSQCKRTFGKDFKFRYLIVSETESKGVREINPHHHVLFFVQQPCNHQKFRDICKQKWPYGWSFGSWDNNGEVCRPNGIRYVTKYVCKDCFALDNDNSWADSFNDVKHGVPLRLFYECKRHQGFTLHSQHFGEFAIKHILDGDSLLSDSFKTSFDYIKKYGKIFVPCLKDGVPGTINIPRSLLRTLFFTPTYRYKRVTKRDVLKCLQRGSVVPKHKVESYYIPKADYYDYYVFKLLRQVSKVNDVAKAVSRSNNNIAPVVALGVSVFSNSLVNENVNFNFDDYVNKVAHIQLVRDPIFKRDPFDGTFFYRRAPLERTDFIELKKFVLSNCDSDSFLSLLVSQDEYSLNKLKMISEYNQNEKTYKDVSKLCQT